MFNGRRRILPSENSQFHNPVILMRNYELYAIDDDQKPLAVLGAFAKLRKATVSFVVFVQLSVRLSAWKYSDFIGRNIIKFWYLGIFWNICLEDSSFHKL